MLNKIKYLAIFFVVGILGWYMFVKPEDYIIKFKVAASPGVLLRQVEEWSLLQNKMDSLSSTLNNKIPFEVIEQSITKGDMSLEINWSFKLINDSITQVLVGVLENENSMYNRITAPFLNTNFKKMSIGLVQDYISGIEYRLKNEFKVKFQGVEKITELRYAYIKIEDINMLDKASKMMEINDKLVKFLNDNEIKDGELPFLIVDRWNFHENTIDFKYCFPVKHKDTLPSHSLIRYGKLPSGKALKAIYNGNYRTSDRAWFTLHDYAKRHGIAIQNKPIEFFKNNPFLGGDELTWVTEVYMPILD
ncbi:GyrI-like domain-containing protein [Litoribaculum gwangyangense]|uniref:GyrI-like small molecule binding domain-containing protein n=1 Tax=Litoribaculum gwangyangense TaxID=1130722 RepID=A0ABP9CQU9_9FLAO